MCHIFYVAYILEFCLVGLCYMCRYVSFCFFVIAMNRIQYFDYNCHDSTLFSLFSLWLYKSKVYRPVTIDTCNE